MQINEINYGQAVWLWPNQATGHIAEHRPVNITVYGSMLSTAGHSVQLSSGLIRKPSELFATEAEALHARAKELRELAYRSLENAHTLTFKAEAPLNSNIPPLKIAGQPAPLAVDLRTSKAA